MNYIKYYLNLFVISAFLFGGCSDINDDITPPSSEVLLHEAGIATWSSENFHGNIIAGMNWDMEGCKQCHGGDYNGGTVGHSCNTCHTNPGGPEACNTCHGSFADPTRIAPPADLGGNVTTTNKGVGAHSIHLYASNLSEPMGCYECHPSDSPSGTEYVSGHINGLPAEMEFGDRAQSDVSIAGYDFNTYQCSNTYCHGNFEFEKSESDYSWAYTEDTMVGNNFSPKWNQVDGTQAACGTCHGLPPQGHVAVELSECATCHGSVVNAAGEIIDNLKHMNGEADVFDD